MGLGRRGALAEGVTTTERLSRPFRGRSPTAKRLTETVTELGAQLLAKGIEEAIGDPPSITAPAS
jgi:hypothetical protein